MNRAYKYRIYPNAKQIELFAKTFGCVRFIYNKMLGDKIEHYKETNNMLYNTPAQYKQEFPWLCDVDKFALGNAQIHLQIAFKNFFNDKKVGFPKFKSKKRSDDKYTTNWTNNNIRVENGSIRLPKVGIIKMKQHRQIPTTHNIKSATISRTPTGKYYVAILTEYKYEIPTPELSKDKAIGLDYASNGFYVDNQNITANYPRFYRNALDKLTQEQRRLSHMKLGSNNYCKQKLKVAKLHEHVANSRKDWIHKESTRLSNEYDYICVEDIDMKAMSRCLNLGKSTLDNGFGMFRNFLQYKQAERGKKLIKINKWFSSSKMCHVCGTINDELKLSDRDWTCECCDTHHLRDHNAAINIKNEGLRMVA